MNLAETPTKSGFNRNAIIFLFDIVIFFILSNRAVKPRPLGRGYKV